MSTSSAATRRSSRASARYDAEWALGDLTRIGRYVGTEEFQRDAERANRIEPELRTHDRHGNRVDEVDYDDSYHRIIRAAVAEGAHTSAWAEPRPGANVARAATFMLFAQIEPGHACPVSMTHAAVPVVAQNEALAEKWMPRLLSRDYDGRLGAPSKPSALFGMAMTEKQGGSDVRANTTRAVDAGDGSYRLTGHKWFCSAPMSDAFLVLAQTPAGLGCFLVPRVLDDGSRNVFRIQRLKDKLGNRANASSEIELDDTVGFLIGEEGRGVRTIIEMVAGTRLDCILGTTAGMRQATAEALWHVRHRRAFGALLVDQPAMTAVVADLALETEAATATALRLARAHDADADRRRDRLPPPRHRGREVLDLQARPRPRLRSARVPGRQRLHRGVPAGAPLPRATRDGDLGGLGQRDRARRAARADARAGESRRRSTPRWRGRRASIPCSTRTWPRPGGGSREVVAADERDAAASARSLVAKLALALQASLLLRTAPAAVSHAFVESRLGDDRGQPVR